MASYPELTVCIRLRHFHHADQKGSKLTAASSPRLRKPKKVAKVDATLDLILGDEHIGRDHRYLEILRNAMRKNLTAPRRSVLLTKRPALYSKFRGAGFPLVTGSRNIRIQWRHLTPWMRVQIASLCMHQQRFCQFRLHLHGDIQKVLANQPGQEKKYIRDRIARCLRDAFDVKPWFWFIIEDLDADGHTAIRAHVHGGIQIPLGSVPTKANGEPTRRAERIISNSGLQEAQLIFGREQVRSALKRAAGNAGNHPNIVDGIDQQNNLWMRKPYMHFSNPKWVSYAFKNTKRMRPSLGPGRLAMSRELNQEAQRLWMLVTQGEKAIDLWK